MGDHETRIEMVPHVAGPNYPSSPRAECACGWKGRKRLYVTSAEADEATHLREEHGAFDARLARTKAARERTETTLMSEGGEA